MAWSSEESSEECIMEDSMDDLEKYPDDSMGESMGWSSEESEECLEDSMDDREESPEDFMDESEEESNAGKGSQNLLGTLYDLLGTHTFACGGEVTPNHLLPNSIFITGLGSLPLPLCEKDATRLQKICDHAPYGKGKKTVVDSKVRRVWQLDASKVRLECQPWKLAASDALTSLGLLEEDVEIKLYKLLLYNKGGHFKPHRDTEKEPGMVATLIFQLPTECGHEGGMLVVKHGRKIQRFGFARNSHSSFYHVAFYADCQHELEEVVEGCRLCLAFNVVRKNVNKDSFMVERLPQNLSRVEAVLKSCLDKNSSESKLVVLLSHQYTEANLSFAGLKGRDRFVTEVLGKCADNLLLDLHLCLLKKHDTYADGYPVEENEFRPKIWISRSDKKVQFESLRLDLLTEIVKHEDDDPLGGLKPDSVIEEPYTGNEGPTEEYYYYLAALVIWPRFLTVKFLYMSSLVNIIERVEDEEANARVDMRELLGICEQYPRKIWMSPKTRNHFCTRLEIGKGEIANRLLKLCLNVGEEEDLLRMINILAKAFGYERPMAAIRVFPSSKTRTVKVAKRNSYGGIGTAEVAKTLALVIKSKGWQPYGISILESLFLKHRFASEAERYAILGLELENLGCHDSAVLVAQKILSFLNCEDEEDFSLQGAALSAIGLLVFTLGQESMVSSFVKQCHYASTRSLYDVVFSLQDEAAANTPSLKENTFFAKLCQMLVDRDLSESNMGDSALAAIGSLAFTLGEESIVTSFVKNCHYASTQSLYNLVVRLKDEAGANPFFLKLCQMLVDRDLLGSNMGDAALSSIGLLAFKLGEESMVSSFVKQSHYASTQSLCNIVVSLKDTAAANSLSLKCNPFFAEMCQILADKVLLELTMGESPQSAAPLKHVRKVMSIIFWLQDKRALDLVLKKVLQEPQTNEILLTELVRDATLWEEAKHTDIGKAALKKLAEECVQVLKSKSKPMFSWCQPDAKVPGYPQLEEFFRGPNPMFTQRNFNSIIDVRKFISKISSYFGRTTINATATEGGRGKDSFCTISKTLDIFNEKMNKWKATQQEIARLSVLIKSICDQEESQVAKRIKTIANGGGLIDLTSEST